MKLLFLLSCLLFFQTNNVEAQGEENLQLWTICYNTTNYTTGSRFQLNLNFLLTSLVSNVSQTGFLYTSVGTNSNRVNGLAQCRGDISMEECRTCLERVTTTLNESCSYRKDALLLWDYCLVRYSTSNFSSQLDNITHPGYGNENRFYDARAQSFDQQLRKLMVNMSSTAASIPSRFSYGQIYYTRDINIYGMTQCNQDLSTADCRSCLLKLLPPSCNSTCTRREGFRIFSTTCWIRYEIYPFLNVQPSPPLESAPPEPTPTPERANGNGKSVNIAVVLVPVIASVIFVAICAFFVIKRKKNKRKEKRKIIYEEDDVVDEETQQYDLNIIKNATDDFSVANKLGEGGFGAVYKGQFLNGQEIAVKRLSKNSGQGSQEFKNEVVLLLKLQHRNLVRLLGYCMEEEEKLLIYEYLPNRSLDFYIFDPSRKSLLDWEMRYKIIGGIARGLLYLHEDSRLRVIHRDLKSGNILLDNEMSAKIADFGLAKLFEVDETAGNTNRIAGTFGYMAPEYALHGKFSTKSDVYSFGVLLLEIVSGLKSINFQLSGPSVDLLSHAWTLWKDGNGVELRDPTIGDNYSEEEILRCIHIGLLCVQDKADDRPTMSTVVLMLTSYSYTVGTPAAPTFITETTTGSTYMSSLNGSTGSLLHYVDSNLSSHSNVVYSPRRSDSSNSNSKSVSGNEGRFHCLFFSLSERRFFFNRSSTT